MHHDPSAAEFVIAEAASLTGAPELDKALLNFENCEGCACHGGLPGRAAVKMKPRL
jgi:hypothetical protein